MGDNVVDALFGAIAKTALERCEVEEFGLVRLRVAFSRAEMINLGQGGTMVAVPKRMEELASSTRGGEWWLPDNFFEHLEYDEDSGYKLFIWEGYMQESKRNMYPMYQVMKELGIKLPERKI